MVFTQQIFLEYMVYKWLQDCSNSYCFVCTTEKGFINKLDSPSNKNGHNSKSLYFLIQKERKASILNYAVS